MDVYYADTVSVLIPVTPGPWMEGKDPIERAMNCRINYKNERTMNTEGEEVVSHINLLCAYGENIDYNYRIRIDLVEYGIISIDRTQDFSSQYQKVYLG